jgi:ankyrin repeat protein
MKWSECKEDNRFYGYSFLTLAVNLNNLEAVKFFVEDLKIDLTDKDLNGNTPIAIARILERMEIFDYIAEHYNNL